jgi:hypothetical protein
MAGKTATIDLTTLRLQWASHSSMHAICTHWTITKDQLIRLKTVASLPPRHDRRFRFKPKRSEYRDPTPEEIAAACLRIKATWDERTEVERRVQKPQAFTLRIVDVPSEAEELSWEPERE